MDVTSHAPQVFYEIMLQGTGVQLFNDFQVAQQEWSAASDQVVAALRARHDMRGTHIHPADLDSLLQLAISHATPAGNPETAIPFAIQESQLQKTLHASELWAGATAPSREDDMAGDSTLKSLRSSTPCAQLLGLRMRSLGRSQESSISELMFETRWEVKPNAAANGAAAQVNLIGGESPPQGRQPRMPLPRKAGAVLAFVFSMPQQRGRQQRSQLAALESALELCKSISPATTLWLLAAAPSLMELDANSDGQHAGVWGLARVVRLERPLAKCSCVGIYADAWPCPLRSPDELQAEQEVSVYRREVRLPRLTKLKALAKRHDRPHDEQRDTLQREVFTGERTRRAQSYPSLAPAALQPIPASLQPTPSCPSPLHSIPFYSTPLHSALLHSTPLHSTPLHSTPLHSTPLYSSPARSSPV